MIDPEDTGDLRRDIARRLRRAREATDMNQLEYGRQAGLSQPHYNLFEKGTRRLTIEAALDLCAAHQLTLDYLYRGDPSGLPYKLHERIKRNIEAERAAGTADPASKKVRNGRAKV